MMAIQTIFGTQIKLSLVSQTHGAVRVPLNQNFDYTPRFTAKTIFEFDRKDAALALSIYEGSDVRFEHLDTDSKLVDAAVNDQAPDGSIVLDDPSNYKELNIFCNIKNDAGKIFQSLLAKGVKIKGSATAEPVRSESRITRDGEALNVLRVKGGAIEYARAVASGFSGYAQAGANDASDYVRTDAGTSTFTLSNSVETLVDGAKYLLALINGTDNAELDSPYDVAITGTSVVVTPALGAQDVIEVFTVYIPS